MDSTSPNGEAQHEGRHEVSGYLTPGEIATLRSRKAAMLHAEWHVDLIGTPTSSSEEVTYAPLADPCPSCGAIEGRDEHWLDCTFSPLGYDGLTDDSTTYGSEEGN